MSKIYIKQEIPISLFSFFFLYTRGLELAKQGLYHLSHAPNPFTFNVCFTQDSW
jgi:hypothetical protein